MTCSYCDSTMPADARYCGECGRSFVATATATAGAGFDRPDDPPTASTWVDGADVYSPAEVPSFAPPDLEKTIIVGASNADSFLLQFSTGERVTVRGSGLVGRHPTPQPGEYFDQLVTLADPGKSVSKTHLEFGYSEGMLWVRDRDSGNGTSLTTDGESVIECTAGTRYPVSRGTRVIIGEQFLEIF